jgi:hypothetical protein
VPVIGPVHGAAGHDETAGAVTQLLGQGTHLRRGSLVQLLPQQPLQLLILPEGGGGLAQRGRGPTI